MSGPIDDKDGSTNVGGINAIEVKEGRTARIGESRILRVLPTKRRRTIGPWCFVDLMAPDDVENPPPLEIGPHPHIGLATVTWLFSGSVLHSDSLGTRQSIRPGQLNLMTASHGIAHAEEGIDSSPADATGGIVGVQMWLAQPDADRHGGSGFQHIAELPSVDLGTGTASILVGELGAERSPAEFPHPTVGLDVQFRAPVDIPTNVAFEYGVVPIDRPIRVEDAIVEPGSLAVVPPGFEQLRIESRDGPGRVMLLGGEPLGVPIKMWWNFVARTTDEITEAWRDWQAHNDDRFGPVTSSLPRIDAPPPPWVRQDR